MDKKPTESAETKQVWRLLTLNWEKVESNVGPMTYSDYMVALTRLQAVTHDIDRTKAIFAAVIHQASEPGRSLKWVWQELAFDYQAEVTGDRAKCLQDEAAAQAASDDALDLYNRRVNDFRLPRKGSLYTPF